MPETTTTVLCGNESHLDEMDEMPAAVSRITWPNGRFKPTTACHECLETIVYDYVLSDEYGQNPVLIVPVGKEPDRADLERLVLRACSDPGWVLPRQGGYGIDGDEYESVSNWQMRAALAVAEPYLAREPAHA
jgi:hypothetical protein